MFQSKIYIKRRDHLRTEVKSGIILFLGNEESPMNYEANTYRFRQDSTFLYYFGLSDAGLAAVIDIDAQRDTIFGTDYGIEDIVWMGPQKSLQDRAAAVGVKNTAGWDRLSEVLQTAISKQRKIHLLPSYREEHVAKMQLLLNSNKVQIKRYVSEELIKAVVELRSVKGQEEVDQIVAAHDTTYEMHTQAMKMAQPGVYERQIAGTLEGIALSRGGTLSFPLIVSVRGEILHNPFHGNMLRDNDLLLIDAGAESEMGYAADITRTIPVSGKFSQQQKQIYEIVLQAQLRAIDAIKPGIKFMEIHLLASTVIAQGLKSLGLMKGDIEQAVRSGAHALFFPHGLGHMIGLDVHDMENLGEAFVGYDKQTQRSDQFGLAYLRLAKMLQAGYVLTVEPGIYFIPALINKWRSEKKFEQFINYDSLQRYKDFGGIRIEDDILVTEKGNQVIGKPIPKKVSEMEKICGS